MNVKTMRRMINVDYRPERGVSQAQVLTNATNYEKILDLLSADSATAVGLSPTQGRSFGSFFIAATAPKEFWITSDSHFAAEWARKILGPQLGDVTIIDQTHGRSLFSLTGSDSDEVLHKGSSLVTPTAGQTVNFAALTSIDHMPVLVMRGEQHPGYRLSVSRSYTHSFVDWLDRATAIN